MRCARRDSLHPHRETCPGIRIPRLRSLLPIALALLVAAGSVRASESDEPVTSQTLVFRDLAPEDRDALLTSMTRTLSNVRDIRVAFRQIRHVSLFSKPLESQGFCLFQRPGRMRWEVLEPWHTILVTDGRHVGRFDYQDGERRRLDPAGAEVLREVLAQISAWIGGDIPSASETYEVRASLPEQNPSSRFRLELVPRQEALREMIRAIELDIDASDGAARSVRVFEPSGDRLEILFEAPVRNEAPPERAFDPRDPAPLAAEYPPSEPHETENAP